MMKSRSRSVLDTPLEPVIGLAGGETRWRSMTIFARSDLSAVAQRRRNCFVRGALSSARIRATRWLLAMTNGATDSPITAM